MYQNLKPKPEGTIFSKRSNASGVGQNSSRRSHHYDMAAESIIRGVGKEKGSGVIILDNRLAIVFNNSELLIFRVAS